MFRLGLNVSFIEQNELSLDLSELDPDSVILDPRFPNHFKVNLTFSSLGNEAQDETWEDLK